jgi:hypothetical protein
MKNLNLPVHLKNGKTYFKGQVCKHCLGTEIAKLKWVNVTNNKIYVTEETGIDNEWCFDCKSPTTIVEHEDHIFLYLDEVDAKYLLSKYPKDYNFDGEVKVKSLEYLCVYILGSYISGIDAVNGLSLLYEKYDS